MRGIQSYRRTTVEGAPNEDLLVMLVEAAIKREDAADEAMERNAREVWIAEIHVARSIFIELRRALDHSIAPDVTAGLDATYRWCIYHLTAAGRTGDRAVLAEVRRVTEVVYTTWTEAVRIAREEAIAGKAAGAMP